MAQHHNLCFWRGGEGGSEVLKRKQNGIMLIRIGPHKTKMTLPPFWDAAYQHEFIWKSCFNLMHLSMFCPRMGGVGGGQPRGNLDISIFKDNFPTLGPKFNVKFPSPVEAFLNNFSKWQTKCSLPRIRFWSIQQISNQVFTFVRIMIRFWKVIDISRTKVNSLGSNVGSCYLARDMANRPEMDVRETRHRGDHYIDVKIPSLVEQFEEKIPKGCHW